jgi:hypothetical protein
MSENALGLGSSRDREVSEKRKQLFAQNHFSNEDMLQNFPSFVRRINITRFLAQYELFKMVQDLPGSIVELGVYKGSSLFAFANFLEIFSPGDRSRKVIGFDSFEGLANFHQNDGIEQELHFKKEGGWKAEGYDLILKELSDLFQQEAFVPQAPRIEIIKGDIVKTVPAYVTEHPGLRISLLHFDCDLYEPTNEGLKSLVPMIVPGGIVVLDEYAITAWAGETKAVDDFFGKEIEIRKFTWSSCPGGYIRL